MSQVTPQTTSQVTLQGNPVAINGTFPQVGDTISNIKLTKTSLEDVTLDNYAGKRKILNIFPSVDTPTCATSVRTFNQKASELANTVVLCISADLPFAHQRFCGAEGIENVESLSTFRNKSVHETLGVDITSAPLAGLTARSVIVLDENNKVIHAELVVETADEPNYDNALAVL